MPVIFFLLGLGDIGSVTGMLNHLHDGRNMVWRDGMNERKIDVTTAMRLKEVCFSDLRLRISGSSSGKEESSESKQYEEDDDEKEWSIFGTTTSIKFFLWQFCNICYQQEV